MQQENVREVSKGCRGKTNISKMAMGQKPKHFEPEGIDVDRI